ncbi:hypothetical protein F2Q68_00036790 [Brassica cretica]|uniref:RNase H type-1 domain-containing protein n=1 Tax=Brassica cretica TaxID=69181 RepID=A0A8S9H474_BRACR|nr:hypothetical protein F2Q68_00036790 [Brassica cretica]
MLHGSLQLKNLVLGGSLFSKEDTLRLQGSTAMEPAHSPLAAETYAMWLAAHQLHILSYNKVAFLGDCQELLKNLDAAINEGTKQRQIAKENAMLQGIKILHPINILPFIMFLGSLYMLLIS